MINKIFWENDKIGVLTTYLDSVMHSHWMIQLFIGIEEKISMVVKGELVEGNCIIVDKKIPHSITSKGNIQFSLIIEPTSDYAQQIDLKIKETGYYRGKNEGFHQLQSLGKQLVDNPSKQQYVTFMDELNNYLDIAVKPKKYDKRIEALLQLLATCDCDDHTIAMYAENVALSASRLSHLFKEQTGIPLKSYLVVHKMEKALEAILLGKSVTEASINAGFDSPSHFAATTKKMMGMPVTSSLKDSDFLKV